MKIRIQPYKRWSGGARALGKYAGILRATPKQVQKHGDFDIIINWGSSERLFRGAYLNQPKAVASASNKLDACKLFAENEVLQPEFTQDMAEAVKWYEDGLTVVCRTLLRANSGRGIVLASKDLNTEVVRAPLYTKYAKKRDEYRIHVFGGEVIDIQQKRKRHEVDNDDVNFQIRNAANGWVFCRGGADAPACVRNAAVRAVSSLDLDFGAVDVGYNARKDQPYVFEVNTAPGLEGTTLQSYFNALSNKYPVLSRGMYQKRRAA